MVSKAELKESLEIGNNAQDTNVTMNELLLWNNMIWFLFHVVVRTKNELEQDMQDTSLSSTFTTDAMDGEERSSWK